MDPKRDPGYSLDSDDLHKALAEAGGTEQEVEKALRTDYPVEQLSTENARLEAEASRALPESPWYLAILLAVLVGVLAGFLLLVG